MTPLNPEEISLMREACQLAARVLKDTGLQVRPGVSTLQLDQFADQLTKELGAVSAPLGYKGFPRATCTSINHVVCHGVPGNEILQEGDIVNVDITVKKNGFHGDTSATFFVGEVSDEAKSVTECAEKAMYKGIEAIRPYGTTGDIGFATYKYVTKKGFFVVHEIGGHGIGRTFHDSPFIPAFGKKGRGEKLIPWTCFTVEPMINVTEAKIVEFDIPGSSVKYYETEDQCLSAQFEHTILVTDTGYEILTLLEGSNEVMES